MESGRAASPGCLRQAQLGVPFPRQTDEPHPDRAGFVLPSFAPLGSRSYPGGCQSRDCLPCVRTARLRRLGPSVGRDVVTESAAEIQSFGESTCQPC